MSGFSFDWLTLREPVDALSRHPDVLRCLQVAFASHPNLRVVDLGCGTGANLRATACLLGPRQSWTLIDHDQALLDAAAVRLSAWADQSVESAQGVVLHKDGRRLDVRFRHADLARDLETSIGGAVDLITASAFFDLVSSDFIEMFALIAARYRSAVYAPMNFDGHQAFLPPHDADDTMLRAFNVHQTSDKGFGPAAGGEAGHRLVGSLTALGYDIVTGDSPWLLGYEQQDLMQRTIGGIAMAVAEIGVISGDVSTAWRMARRSSGRVGHIDVLAIPGPAIGHP